MKILLALVTLFMSLCAAQSNAAVIGRLDPGQAAFITDAPGRNIGENANFTALSTFWSDNPNAPTSFKYFFEQEYQWFQYAWDLNADPPVVLQVNSANGFVDVTYLNTSAGAPRSFRTDYASTYIDGRDADGAGELFWRVMFAEIIINTGNNPLNYKLSYSAQVPEPATWAFMLAGFALAGAGLRRQRKALHSA